MVYHKQSCYPAHVFQDGRWSYNKRMVQNVKKEGKRYRKGVIVLAPTGLFHLSKLVQQSATENFMVNFE